VATELRLLEDGNAVADDLEPTAARGEELHLRAGNLLTQLGRQTGGPWLVVSNGAVLDGDVHDVGSM